jgi:hypothetical protein
MSTSNVHAVATVIASAVHRVGLWVGSLEAPLNTYRQAFEHHDIDGATLCGLTDRQLEQIGIEQVVRSRSSDVYTVLLVGPILAAPEQSHSTRAVNYMLLVCACW